MLKRLIGRAAVWAGRAGVARVLLYVSGAVLLAAFVASMSGTGGWLFPSVAAVAAVTGVAAARRAFTTPRPSSTDVQFDRDIAASLTDEALAWAVGTWSKRYR
ncbi:hypothetical protein HZU40_00025 (plasmid) [Mycolicibacterium fluoranthenivorans]|uniref:Uncharacterized protein n=1 Tax=Mycolicibacterium fluoranthenivorans TaxID=258505 RepID=A0A7G8P6D2_9MYCO|nr:hypothetical protein [Mycolicibacterium fluoranthenivorans]QNJ89898.1 hypothetical protein HZU40_00025 [Mycolicibacterium fluoranthenivorans]